MKHNELNHPANNKSSYWGVASNEVKNGVLLQVSDGDRDARIVLTTHDVAKVVKELSKAALACRQPTHKSEPGNALCYRCKYRGTVPGSCHSSCSAYSARVKADDHGIKMGWFIWPLDFDPVWLESCTGYEPKQNTKT